MMLSIVIYLIGMLCTFYILAGMIRSTEREFPIMFLVVVLLTLIWPLTLFFSIILAIFAVFGVGE